VDLRQRTASFPYGSSDGVDDVGLGHGSPRDRSRSGVDATGDTAMITTKQLFNYRTRRLLLIVSNVLTFTQFSTIVAW
jgi:hypothetical protein